MAQCGSQVSDMVLTARRRAINLFVPRRACFWPGAPASSLGDTQPATTRGDSAVFPAPGCLVRAPCAVVHPPPRARAAPGLGQESRLLIHRAPARPRWHQRGQLLFTRRWWTWALLPGLACRSSSTPRACRDNCRRPTCRHRWRCCRHRQQLQPWRSPS